VLPYKNYSLTQMENKKIRKEILRHVKMKVVGPFPKPCASRSYMHQAALFKDESLVLL
jgi:hypothetical protein